MEKKVGIDAKWYFDGPPSGRVVIKNLVDYMILSNPSFCIYLFVNIKFKQEALKLENDNVKIVFTKIRPNLLTNFIELPYLAWKLKLDLIVFQSFVGPLPTNVLKVAFVFDMLFLDYPEFFSYKELAYFKLMPYSVKMADYVITISYTEKERLVKHKVASSKFIDVLYLGVNENFKTLEEYSNEQKENFKKRHTLPERYLLYVGRLNVRKNIVNLVKSLPYLIDKEIKLIIVGGKDYKHDILFKYIKSSNLENRVLFSGYINDEDLLLYYAYSKIFCFPSLAEGFGIPPLEAMKCGVPAVVSDRTSLPEICGNAGLYINPTNPEDIAEKIDSLLLNKEFYSYKQKQSILHANNFRWSIVANEFISLLSKYIK